MTRLLALLAIGTIGFTPAPALAQDTPKAAPPAAAEPPADPALDPAEAPIDEAALAAMFPKAPLNAESFPAEAKTPEAIKAGAELLEKIAAKYRTAPTITDTVEWSVKLPGGEQRDTLTVRMGGGQDLELSAGTMTMTSHDGSLYLVDSSIAEKFVKVDLDGSVTNTLKTKLDGFELPCPHLGLRWGAPDKALESFSFGGGSFSKVSGFQEKDGIASILVSGEGDSDLRINANAKDLLVRSMALVMAPPGAPAGIRFAIDFAFAPVVAEKLEKPIGFDAGKRTAVGSLQELMEKPAAISKGQAAPAFTLKDNNGNEVSLESLRGKVVVIDFWATWCGPCRKGLPVINSLAQWVADSKTNAVVYGINVWERGTNSAEKVKEYWAKEKFSFPYLTDADSSVIGKYGFDGIPATVIIGPDGMIAAIHEGFDPKGDLLGKLKEEVTKALGGKG